MKVESIRIQNFKKFQDLELNFKNLTLDEINDRVLILGDNGSGKTTILQAIALTLGLAMRRFRRVDEFNWLGFVPGRYSQWGKPHIELMVTFSKDEIEATQAIAQQWDEARSDEERASYPFIKPGSATRVVLRLSGERCTAPTREELWQFRGRYFATQLRRTNPNIHARFSDLPGIFWFDQFRNLASPSKPDVDNNTPYVVGVAQLRRYLNGWQLARQQVGRNFRNDYLMELENLYKKIFPGRSFAGVELKPGKEGSLTDEDFYFLLSDGNRMYDIEEMSGGEQSIFPILYEFVRLQIENSVVLIDEVDLNLHPPAAQSLVAQLLKIRQNCQYFLTTHSESVVDVISDEEIYRLQGGALCL